MQHVTSKDGTMIGFTKKGSGPPLVLVHGTTADHSRWLPIFPRLVDNFTLYAIDRRGRGESEDGSDYDIMREAEDVAAVVDSIDEPAFLVGHSFGAICSLEGALLTDNLRKLALYEPPILSGDIVDTSEAAAKIQALADEKDLEGALEVFFRDVVEMSEEELEAYRKLEAWEERIGLAPTISRELKASSEYEFDEKKFLTLKVPTLLMLGGDSPDYFRHAAENVFSTLPNSMVVVLPDQAHVAMDTAPELFVRTLIDFLEDD